MRRKIAAGFFSYNLKNGYSLAHNKRITSCCDNECIRDRLDIVPASNTDLGAEIHAEQALLIATGGGEWFPEQTFMLAGFDRKGKVLQGFHSWPCYSCARMLLHVGVRRAMVLEVPGVFKSYLLREIIDYYEQETLNVLRDT